MYGVHGARVPPALDTELVEHTVPVRGPFESAHRVRVDIVPRPGKDQRSQIKDQRS